MILQFFYCVSQTIILSFKEKEKSGDVFVAFFLFFLAFIEHSREFRIFCFSPIMTKRRIGRGRLSLVIRQIRRWVQSSGGSSLEAHDDGAIDRTSTFLD